MKLTQLFISLAVFSISSHANIYQCSSNEFRDTPCPKGNSQNLSQPPTSSLPSKQQKLCKNIGKYAESLVDTYISGISRTEAIQQIETNHVTPTTSELLIKITNSSYDDLEKIGKIQTQDVRTHVKNIMNTQGELTCVETLSLK